MQNLYYAHSFSSQSWWSIALEELPHCRKQQQVFTWDVHEAYSVECSQIILRCHSAALMTRLAPCVVEISDVDNHSTTRPC